MALGSNDILLGFRIHLGIKPYQCSICKRQFTDNGACKAHMKTHTGENKHVSQCRSHFF